MSDNRPTPGREELTEIAHQLGNLSRRFESFLQQQVERLKNGLQNCHDLKSEADVVRKMMEDFEEQKRHWEMQRDSEIKRLSIASSELAEAWKQLEDEQRQLLIDRNVHQRKPDMEHEFASKTPPQTATVNMAAAPTDQSSIFDFQQLQMQVRQHAQRTR